jgi:hypothetical protein
MEAGAPAFRPGGGFRFDRYRVLRDNWRRRAGIRVARGRPVYVLGGVLP